MNHLEIINHLIKTYDFKSYLEIGVYDGNNFNGVICESKECCDPCVCDVNVNCEVTYKMTSDEMFEQMPDDKKYDIIFIDGMHDESFVDRDIMNSLKHLNKNGVICLHDTFPPSKNAAEKFDTYTDNRGNWCGDVFKSVLKLHETNLEYHTVNNGDFGLSIIRHSDNPNADLQELTCDYEYDNIFSSSQTTTELGKELLHEISVEQFKEIYNPWTMATAIVGEDGITFVD